MAPVYSCVRACVDACAYIHLGSFEAYKEAWFFHSVHYLGKKYKTKPVSAEHFTAISYHRWMRLTGKVSVRTLKAINLLRGKETV